MKSKSSYPVPVLRCWENETLIYFCTKLAYKSFTDWLLSWCSWIYFQSSAMQDEKTDHIDAIFMTLAHKLKASKPLTTSVMSNSGGRYSRTNDRGSMLDMTSGRSQTIHLSGDNRDTEGNDSDCKCWFWLESKIHFSWTPSSVTCIVRCENNQLNFIHLSDFCNLIF